MGCSQSHGTGGSKSGEHALHCSDRTTCEVPSEHLHTSHAGVPEGALFPMADDSLFDTVVTAKGEDRFVWQLRLSEAALRRKMEACSPSFIMRGRAWCAASQPLGLEQLFSPPLQQLSVPRRAPKLTRLPVTSRRRMLAVSKSARSSARHRALIAAALCFLGLLRVSRTHHRCRSGGHPLPPARLAMRGRC